MPASVAARLAGVRADSSIFYYLDGANVKLIDKEIKQGYKKEDIEDTQHGVPNIYNTISYFHISYYNVACNFY